MCICSSDSPAAKQQRLHSWKPHFLLLIPPPVQADERGQAIASGAVPRTLRQREWRLTHVIVRVECLPRNGSCSTRSLRRASTLRFGPPILALFA